MIFRGIRTISVVLACALTPVASAPAKAVSSDAQVQMLANFPALQRLAAKGNAGDLRRYLTQVAAAYRAAGYNAVADALPKADDVIALFGDANRATESGALKQARAAMRHLKSSLSKNRRIVLPSHIGDQIPNYYAIAAAFVENSDKALKNLSAGKNVANTLRQKTGTLVVKNETSDTFTVTGTGSYSSAVTFNGGTLSLAGGNTYSGATTINAGSLALDIGTGSFTLDRISDGSNYSFGSTTTFNLGSSDLAFGSVSGSGTLIKTGSGTLSLSGTNTFSGGTLITGGTLVASSSLSFGTGRISINGGALTISSSDTWAIFPSGIEIPADFGTSGPVILLQVVATINDVAYSAGTRIVKPTDPSALPDGAIALIGSIFITTAPTSSPTPTPTPAE